jgi:hypothetical protein
VPEDRFAVFGVVCFSFKNVRAYRVLVSAGRYPSGQRGQTVNLLAYVFQGSNPCLPTKPRVRVPAIHDCASRMKPQLGFGEGKTGRA